MHADHHYEIGTSHPACEDYALSGTRDGLTWAIVSDGCSSSKNTDVGARILAHAAQKTLIGLSRKMTDEKFMKVSFCSVFYELLQHRIQSTRVSLGLDWDSLDATLLLAYARAPLGILAQPLWGAMAIGDGHIVVSHGDGSKTHVGISYESGAPYYLSYNMCPEKDEGYRKAFGPDRKLRVCQTYHRPQGDPDVKEWTESPYAQISYCVDNVADPGFQPAQITLLSDGLGSFENCTWVQDTGQAVRAVTDYKALAGEFVRRRMRGFRKSYEPAGGSHYDDLACAAITMVEA